MTPSNQNKLSQIAASKAGGRLFRMPQGLMWVGKIVAKTDTHITLADYHPVKSAINGMSDSTGWVSVTITPEMVGQKVAVYLAVEDKSGSGRPSTDQKNFIRAVVAAGGRAGVARNDEDVVRIVRGLGNLLGVPPDR